MTDYKKTTLSELGQKLPIGYEVGGSLLKNFEMGSWKMKQEKELGEVRKKDKSMGGFVAKMMGILMTRIGPHAMKELGESEQALILNQSYMADIMYMYMCLRRHYIGNEIELSVTCPSCEHEFVWTGNLDTLDVICVDESEQINREIVLRDGIKIMGDIRKRLTIRPPKWAIVSDQNVLKTNNEVERSLILIKNSIVGAEGIDPKQPIAIFDEDIDEVERYDYALLQNVVDESPGPNMTADIVCERLTCRFKWLQMIRWDYDSFFSISSRSQNGKS